MMGPGPVRTHANQAAVAVEKLTVHEGDAPQSLNTTHTVAIIYLTKIIIQQRKIRVDYDGFRFLR